MNYLKKILAFFDRIELDGLSAYPDPVIKKLSDYAAHTDDVSHCRLSVEEKCLSVKGASLGTGSGRCST